MLTDTQQTRMRTTIARTFIDTVVIHRPAATADAEGNPAGELTTVATTVGRWHGFLPGAARGFVADEIAGQAGQQAQATITLTIGTDLRPGDLVDVHDLRWRVLRVVDGRLQLRAFLERAER